MRNLLINKKSWDIITIPFEADGVDSKTHEYDAKSCLDIMSDLDENGCFSKLSVNVTIARQLIEGDEAKGYATVGQIVSFNTDNSVTLRVTGKGLEYIDIIKSMAVKPRVLTATRSLVVNKILGFEILDFYKNLKSVD